MMAAIALILRFTAILLSWLQMRNRKGTRCKDEEVKFGKLHVKRRVRETWL